MQTVNVRVLLPDDVDRERFVERLGSAARHTEVLGAVELVDDGSGRLIPTSRVHGRSSTPWGGGELITTSSLERQVSRVQALARELYG